MIDLIKQLNDKGVYLYVMEGKLKVKASREVFTESLRQEISENRNELLDYLSIDTENVADAIPALGAQDSYELSSSQRRLWILSQFESGNAAYNMSNVYEFEGVLDATIFEAAFHQLIARHESLRTVFKEDAEGNIKQWILPEDQHNFKFNYNDLSASNEVENETERLVREEIEKVFDLEKDSLLSARLVQTGTNSYVFVFVIHHIISDGWSMNVLVKDLLSYYDGLVTKTAIALPKLNIQYKDFSAWQQGILQAKDGKLSASKQYWLDQFSGEIPVLNMPLSHKRPAVQTFNGNSIRFKIDQSSTKQLKEVTQAAGATLFMGLLASINVLLHKHTRQTDIVLGSPIAGREHIDLRNQIGFYVNTLAIRTSFTIQNSFKELLASVKENTLNAYEHQHYPFDELVDNLSLQRDRSRNPLFDVMVVLQNNDATSAFGSFAGLKISPYTIPNASIVSKFDLTLNFAEVDHELELEIEYNSDLFNKETIVRLNSHLSSLIQALTLNPTLPIAAVNYLSTQEEQLLLSNFNPPPTDYPKDKTVLELFEAQVARTPDNVALVFNNVELTYKELNERANQFGDYLRKTYSIQPDDLVAIMLDRSEWMIISIWAVLKSGGAYVPIDPTYPQDRIDYTLNDANAKAVINNKELQKFKAEANQYSTDNLTPIAKADHLAYAIYTSGSTGKPKGVLVENRGLVNHILNVRKEYNITSESKFLQFLNVAFDASVEEIFSSLCAGASLIISANHDPNAVISLINTHHITHAEFPTAFFENLVLLSESYPIENPLQVCGVGGDKLRLDVIATNKSKIERLAKSVFNVYGPTEITVTATRFDVLKEINTLEVVPIGKPYGNRKMYILDDTENLVPIGVIGEICIAGAGLARGYLNRPDLTAKKFVNNPFENGQRMYKTGDLGRWLPDGNIEFIGRQDDQVKIRGYRIELGEIEAALNQHTSIQDGVVLARENEEGDKQLVAYVKSEQDLNTNDLRNHLKGSLPDYMLPAYFVQLAAFPLTPNGKLDKKALPSPEGLGLNSGIEYVRPGTKTEKQVANIWSEVLKLEAERIGVHDDFFALGGHSLKATTVISKIAKRLNVKLSIKDIFEHTTIKGISSVIENSATAIYQDIAVLPSQENYQLSSAQRRLWVLSQLEKGNYAYNMPGVYEFKGNLDIEAFKHAFTQLIARHESLRTMFKQDNKGTIKQWVLAEDAHLFTFNHQDLRKNKNQEETIKLLVKEEVQHVFDLENDALLRATLIQQSADSYVFVFVMHHIISDGWSMNILVRDLFTFYNGLINKTPVNLPDLRIQYKDYAGWQQGILAGDNTLSASKQYWLDQFSGEIPILSMPLDHPRPAVKTFNGGTINSLLSKATNNQLKAITQQTGSTLFMSLLASVKVLLYKYTRQTDIVIGSPIAGREHIDLNDQIGFYINTLSLRSTFSPETNFKELLRSIKENTLKAYEHQNYPFDELVDDLQLVRDMSRNPLFDIMVVLQNNEQTDVSAALNGLEVTPYSNTTESVISKFDITFNFAEQEGQLGIVTEYNSDLFDKSTIERLNSHLIQLIDSITKHPESPISTLPYLSQTEEQQLLVDFNDQKADYPKEKSVIELFEVQVARTPDQIAIVFNEVELTYGELNERANQLGDYLRTTYSIKPDDLVAIMLDRSEWMIVSIWAVLKSGGAYVPIDPEYPQDRINYLLADSAAKALIDQSELETFLAKHDNYQNTNLVPTAQSDHLAYVIYTSGSTGKPKGVLIEHRNLMHSTFSRFKYYNDEYKNALLVSSFAFDSSISIIFTTILSGGTLHVLKKELINEIDKVSKYITANKIDTTLTVPSYYQLLFNYNPGNLSNVKNTILAGEYLHLNLLQSIIDSNFKESALYNEYGPTENTVWTTVHQYQGNNVVNTIGRPISNTRIYILDDTENLLPIGVIGEICIAGAGLARGYLNRPDLTAKKFVNNPFEDGKRMYKTGDLGRWLPDGNIEFIGRKDDQVKIRGYRIELGEIEAALNQHTSIQEGVVLAKENESADKQLVAYVTSDQALNTNDLRTHLKSSLPDYMVPAYFVQLEDFPLTPNGKLDKKALPSPEGLGLSSGIEYVAPYTKIEKQLVQIWSEVLKVDPEKIGIHEDFFALGGDSIKSIQISSKMKAKGYRLEVKDILSHSILFDQALCVATDLLEIPQDIVEGEAPLGAMQHSFLYDDNVDKQHFHQSVGLRSHSSLEPEQLNNLFTKLIEHHDALRMVYNKQKGVWIQYNQLATNKFKIEVHDLSSSNNVAHQITAISNHTKRSFNLNEGPLIKVCLFKTQAYDELLITVHHLVIDGVSWRILFEDIATLFTQINQNQPLRLPLKSHSFKHWLEQIHLYANDYHTKERDYWNNVLSQQVSPIPFDHVEGTNDLKDLVSAGFSLSKQETTLLLSKVNQAYKTEINDILLTAFVMALKAEFGIQTTSITIEGHGREDIIKDLDTSRTVGWFTSVYPVVFDLSYEDLCAQLIEVKDTLRRVPNKGVGYDIFKQLSNHKLKEAIPPQIIFNYLGDFGGGLSKEDGDSLFDFSPNNFGEDVSLNRSSEHHLSVSGMQSSGELNLSIRYSNKQFNKETIDRLAASYEHSLKKLITVLSEKQEQVKTSGDYVYKALSQQELGALTSSYPSIENIASLSPMQQGIYYHWLTNKQSVAYVEQVAYTIKGEVDVSALEKSYRLLIKRYDVLRANFTQDLLQIISSSGKTDFRYKDVSNVQNKQEAIDNYLKEDKEEGFDLHEGCLMRFSVLKLSDDAYEFVWTNHHVLTDGWCISILNGDFFKYYKHYVETGTVLDLGKPSSYLNYIEWLTSREDRVSRAYWSQYLEGYSEVNTIPKLKGITQRGKKTFANKEIEFSLSKEKAQELKGLCADLGITLNALIQSIWGIVLSKYSNSKDVVFGSVVSGRPSEIEGIQEMVGLFINTIPVRVCYQDDQTLKTVVKQVNQQAIEALDHHYLPLAEVQGLSEVGNALIDHLMVFENYPLDETLVDQLQEGDGLGFSITGLRAFEQTNYDFAITVQERETLVFDFKFNTSVYDDFFIHQLTQHFEQLLINATAQIDGSISALPYLSQAEEQQLLVDFNETKADFPNDKTIIALFEEQVKETPDQVAIVFEEKELTYQELNERANELGDYLRKSYSIQPDDLVAIMLERSEWMIVSILAVLKSGGAYVPIDPAYPQERIDYLLTDSAAKVLIDQNELDAFLTRKETYSKTNLDRFAKPHHLAYVIYTSGSTGKPKGVLVENRSVVNYLCFSSMNYTRTEIVAPFFTNLAFDLTVTSIYNPLITGGKLIVGDHLTTSDLINEVISDPTITQVKMTPTHVNLLANREIKNENINAFILGGEALSNTHVNTLKKISSTASIYNEYGPTETTVGVVVKELNEKEKIVIGRPISNTRVYILDDADNLLPIGVIGEICIAGAGLARGYLNRPDLTPKKFVSNPFEDGKRMYKTGDLGRWLPDGNIEFIGRKDDQVKIRGYRIELGEIEAALIQHTSIQEGVVLAKENESGDKQLVAYIKSEKELNTNELRTHLKSSLPDYMLPAYFVQLTDFPLTPNGKLDKKALPSPEGLDLSSGIEYVAPTTKIEKQLVRVWSEVLKVEAEKIGIHEDFFALGGDSIKSIQISSKMKAKGYRLEVKDILSHSILLDQSLCITTDFLEIPQDTVEGEVPLGAIQQSFLYDDNVDKQHFHQSVGLRSHSSLEPEQLNNLFTKLIEHHDALRMVYHKQKDVWVQYNQPATNKFKIEVHDLSSSNNVADQITAISNQVKRSFNLQEGPLIKVCLFKTPAYDELLITVHHLVIDGVSWRIIFEDIATLFTQINQHHPLRLPLKSHSFKHWLEQIHLYANDYHTKERDYWNKVLSQQVSPIPLDHLEGTNALKDIVSTGFSLSKQETTLLLSKVNQAYKTEINDILLTALVLALKAEFGIQNTSISMEGHGREAIIKDLDTSRTVGWFSSLYPVVFDLSYEDLCAQLIEVKDTLRRVPNKGVGYHIFQQLSTQKLTDAIHPQIIFNYLGDFGEGLSKKDGDSLFEFSSNNFGEDVSLNRSSEHHLSVSGMQTAGELNLSIRYSHKQFNKETIDRLAASYEHSLKKLITVLSEKQEQVKTSGDYVYKALSQQELGALTLSYPSVENIASLSPMQQGIYYHWLTDKHSATYVEQLSYTIKGEVDQSALEKSYAALITRYDVLRANFTEDLLQVISSSDKIDFRYKDISQLQNQQAWVDNYLKEDKEEGFDLKDGALMRFAVLKLKEDAYEFVWTNHHILSDGWCISILNGDFFKYYKHYVETGTALDLPKPSSYLKYISWLTNREERVSREYWNDYLKGYNEVNTIPKLKGTASKHSKSIYKEIDFSLSSEKTKELKTLCSNLGITLNSLVQSIWGVVLSKYSNSRDVVFGSVVSGRPSEIEGIQEMVGLFINTVPVRVSYQDDQTLKTVVKEVNQQAIKALDHHYLPLAEVQGLSEVGNALIDHLMVFENYPLDETLVDQLQEGDGLGFSITRLRAFEQTNYNFAITVQEQEAIVFEFKFNASVYDESFIHQLTRHFERLLINAVAQIDASISALPYLSKTEEQQLLVDFNDTNADYSKDKTIIALFEAQANKTPDQVAIVFQDIELTYQELNERANQLGDYLRKSYSIQPDDLVAIMLERSEWMIVTILAVLKSGGAYVPIDSAYPQERIDYLLTDSAAKVLIDQHELDTFLFNKEKYSKTNLDRFAKPNHLAYVIYTSGSTGKPKGVLVENRSVVNTIEAQITTFKLDEYSRGGHYASFAFDASVFELFSIILSGGILVLIDEENRKDVVQLSALIDQKDVSFLTVPSLVAKQLDPGVLKGIEIIVCAGDTVDVDLYSTTKNIWNCYGPTECSIWTNYYKNKNGLSAGSIPIGRPIANTRIYILDDHENLLPIGVIGEICIAGAGLARGYLNRPDLTAEKFVNNPFEDEERMYKTGDLGRWLPDGNIEFIGRKDDQVKIRGYRIELGEIEAALHQHTSIQECVVLAKENEKGDKQLVAYVTSEQDLNTNELRTHLKGSLPDFMVPAYFVQLAAFPLTPNGKLDKKALPSPEGLGLNSGIEYVAPSTKTEKQVVNIWSEILKLEAEKIGVHDDFFALGGHSLKATTVISQIAKQLNVKLSIKDIFEHTTIEGISSVIENSTTSIYQDIEIVPPQENYQLSSAQRRLWVLSQLEEGNYAYNMPGVYELKGNLDLNALEHSFTQLISRHESLRTIFKQDNEGTIKQWILAADAHHFSFNYQDLRKNNNQEETIKLLIKEEVQHVFDLEYDALLRATLIQQSADSYIFVFVMHHIISDGWSMNILLRDLFTYYNGFINNTPINLPDLRIQYKDYSSWQQGILSGAGDKLSASKTYWLDQFSGALPVLNMPLDHPRPALQTFNGGNVYSVLNKDTTNQLKSISQQTGATLFMSLLASVNVLLYKYTGQTDIVIGSPIAGREHVDLNDQIGFYINTLSLRSIFTPETNFKELLLSVKENTLKAYEHQNYPFDELVDDLQLVRDLSRNPLFDSMVVLQNNEQLTVSEALNGLEVTPYADATERVISKFDITFNFVEQEGQLNIGIEYNSDLFDQSTIERLSSHLIQLIDSITKHPEFPISSLPYLSQTEEQQLLIDFNDTKADYPKDKTIIALFEEQAHKTPDHVAIVFEETQLTYGTLNEKANQLGDYLRKTYSIQPDDLVAIMLDRSEWMIVSILAVLKSGGAYVPIDPEYPQDRIEFLVADSAAKVLIDQMELNTFLSKQSDYQSTNLELTTQSDHLAYVIYTSGSTGKPKGVLIENRSVMNLISSQSSTFNFSSQEKVLQFSNIAFDASVEQIFIALFNGAEVHLLNKYNVKDANLIGNYMDETGITHFHAVPGFIEALNPKFTKRLSRLIAGGDQLSQHLMRNAPAYSDHFINEYGPTEVTVTCIQKAVQGRVKNQTIGRPIANTRIYILDKNEALLPIGVVGEICISGAGLARGYLNRPALTAEKFVSNPYEARQRMYKTGDLGRWLPDGNIEFIGRKDDQVKIRGYRIELGEIEAVLNQHASIQESVVVAKENEEGDKQLAAYLRAELPLNSSDVRTYLKERLPDYMVPSYFVQLEEFPVTPNGKLDKKGLPNPAHLSLTSAVAYVAPRTDLEQQLVNIWSDVLTIKKEKIGIHDDFFALGGHSFKAIQLINKVEKQLGKQVTLQQLFTNPSIEAISKSLSVDSIDKQLELVQRFNFNHENDQSFILFPYAGALLGAYDALAKELSSLGNVYIVSLPWHHWDIDSDPVALSELKSVLIEEFNLKVPKKDLYLLGTSIGTNLAMFMGYALSDLQYSVKGIFQCAQYFRKEVKTKTAKEMYDVLDLDKMMNMIDPLLPIEDLSVELKRNFIDGYNKDTNISYAILQQLYDYQPLDTPIHCVFGENDEGTKNHETATDSWSRFSEALDYSVIPDAGHYFVNSHTKETVSIIVKKMKHWNEKE